MYFILASMLFFSCQKIQIEKSGNEPTNSVFGKIVNPLLRDVAIKVEKNSHLKTKIKLHYGELKWEKGIQINDLIFLVPITTEGDSLKAIMQFEKKLNTYFFNIISRRQIDSEKTDPNQNLFEFFKHQLQSNISIQILTKNQLQSVVKHKVHHINTYRNFTGNSNNIEGSQVCYTYPSCTYQDTPECSNGCDRCPECVESLCYTSDPGPGSGWGSCGNGSQCESIEPGQGGGGGGGNIPMEYQILSNQLNAILNTLDSYSFNQNISSSSISFSTVSAFNNLKISHSQNITFDNSLPPTIISPNDEVRRVRINLGVGGGVDIFVTSVKVGNVWTVTNVTSSDYGVTFSWSWEQIIPQPTPTVNGNEITVNVFGYIKYNVFLEGLGTVYKEFVHFRIKINKLTNQLISITKV